jgi:hypothetical protein
MRYIAVLLLALSLFCGCIGLPSTASKLPAAPGVPAVGAKATGSPARRAIQVAVNYTTTLSILGGLACLAFGGLAIYGGQILPGIKLVIAGLLLPIAGIYWAYHWLLWVAIILIGLAVWLLVTHYTQIRPALVAIEAWAQSVEARLVGTANKAPAASVAATASVKVAAAAPVSATSVLAAIHKV